MKQSKYIPLIQKFERTLERKKNITYFDSHKIIEAYLIQNVDT